MESSNLSHQHLVLHFCTSLFFELPNTFILFEILIEKIIEFIVTIIVLAVFFIAVSLIPKSGPLPSGLQSLHTFIGRLVIVLPFLMYTNGTSAGLKSNCFGSSQKHLPRHTNRAPVSARRARSR